MAASDHLSQRQFFHGSPEHFDPGDVVKPGGVVGKKTRSDSDPLKVYVTPHQFVAAQYTYAFDPEGKLSPGQDTAPHGHIYEVAPAGRLVNDKNAPHGMKGLSYTAREAKVIRKLDPKEWR